MESESPLQDLALARLEAYRSVPDTCAIHPHSTPAKWKTPDHSY